MAGNHQNPAFCLAIFTLPKTWLHAQSGRANWSDWWGGTDDIVAGNRSLTNVIQLHKQAPITRTRAVGVGMLAWIPSGIGILGNEMDSSDSRS